MIQKYGKMKFIIAKHFIPSLLNIEISNNKMFIDNRIKLSRLLDFQECFNWITLQQQFVLKTDRSQIHSISDIYFKQNKKKKEKQEYYLDQWINSNQLDKINIGTYLQKLRSNQDYLEQYNILFQQQKLNHLFYQECKKVQEFRNDNQIQIAIQQFQQHIQADNQVLKSQILQIIDNKILLQDFLLNHINGQALKLLFSKISIFINQPELIIDGCLTSDGILQNIVEGLSQNNCICRITLKNCKIGHQDLMSLQKYVFANLKEFRYFNVQFIGNQNQCDLFKSSLFSKLPRIQQLKLNDIDLSQQSIQICQFIQNNKFIQLLDLSKSNLQPKNLVQISQILIKFPNHIKSLNLSYNQLFQKYGNQVVNNWTFKFLDNFSSYLKTTHILNHLNLSGLQLMKIGKQINFLELNQKIQNFFYRTKNMKEIQQYQEQVKEQIFQKQRHEIIMQGSEWNKILKLNEQINECKNLLAVHLSDNGIFEHVYSSELRNKYPNYNFYKDDSDAQIIHSFLEPFNIKIEDVIKIQESNNFQKTDTYESISQTTYEDFKNENNINYFDYQQAIHLIQQQNDSNIKIQAQNNNLSIPNKTDIKIKNEINDIFVKKQELIQDAKIRYINKNKEINDIKTKQEDIRYKNANDRFILKRYGQQYCPEMVQNNQKTKIEIDFPKQWQICNQDKNIEDCHICNKHVYTLFFINLSNIQSNQGLVEINNQDLLQQIQNDFKLSQKEYINPNIPLITASFLKNDLNQKFKQKQIMIRADIFTLLMISQRKKLVRNDRISNEILKGCQYLIENEVEQKSNLYEKYSTIKEQMNGWHNILNEFICQDQLQETIKVNYQHQLQIKEWDDELQKQNKDIYVYPVYLSPGAHQIIIYSPSLNKAFCKEIIVDLNNNVFEFPEFPTKIYQVKSQNQKIKKNLFDKVLKQQYQQQKVYNAFCNDKFPRNFNIDQYYNVYKNDEIQQCLQTIQNNYNDLIKLHKIALVSSQNYPFIDKISFCNIIQQILAKNQSNNLNQQDVDIVFQEIQNKKNKHEESINQKNCKFMQRQQFIEAIIAVSHNIYQNDSISQSVSNFIQYYINPFLQKQSPELSKRQIEKINRLFSINLKQFKNLYDKLKHPTEGFNIQSVELMFNDSIDFINNNRKAVPSPTLKKCFVNSLDIVENDALSAWKYKELTFYKFLNMIINVGYEMFLKIKTNVEIEKYIFNMIVKICRVVNVELIAFEVKAQTKILLQESDYDDQDSFEQISINKKVEQWYYNI